MPTAEDLKKKYGLTPTPSTPQDVKAKYGIGAEQSKPVGMGDVKVADATFAPTGQAELVGDNLKVRRSIPTTAPSSEQAHPSIPTSTPAELPKAQPGKGAFITAPADDRPDAVTSKPAGMGDLRVKTGEGENNPPMPKPKAQMYGADEAQSIMGAFGVGQEETKTEVESKATEISAAQDLQKQIEAQLKAEFERNKRLKELKANPMWLAAAIKEGRILPDEMDDVTADQIPWDTLRQVGGNAVAQISDLAKENPEAGRKALLDYMQNRETTGYDVMRSIKSAGTDLITLGAQKMDVPPQTKEGEFAYFGTQVAGQIPFVLGAEATVPARLANPLARGAIIGAELAGARELAGSLARPEEASLKKSLQNIATNAAEYAAYMGVYSKLTPRVDALIAKSPALEKILSTIPGEALKGGAVGAAAGAGVGTGKVVLDTLMGEGLDVRAMVRRIGEESGQEMKEEIVEAIAMGIAQGIGKRFGINVNVPAKAQTTTTLQAQAQPSEQQPAPRTTTKEEPVGLKAKYPEGATMEFTDKREDGKTIRASGRIIGYGKNGEVVVDTGKFVEAIPQERIITVRGANTGRISDATTATEKPAEAPMVDGGPVVSPVTPETSEAPQDEQQPLNRVEHLRDANPGMDEKAIQDMVKTTVNLSDKDFRAFAQRVGKPEESPQSSSNASPMNTQQAELAKRLDALLSEADNSALTRDELRGDAEEIRRQIFDATTPEAVSEVQRTLERMEDAFDQDTFTDAAPTQADQSHIHALRKGISEAYGPDALNAIDRGEPWTVDGRPLDGWQDMLGISPSQEGYNQARVRLEQANNPSGRSNEDRLFRNVALMGPMPSGTLEPTALRAMRTATGPADFAAKLYARLARQMSDGGEMDLPDTIEKARETVATSDDLQPYEDPRNLIAQVEAATRVLYGLDGGTPAKTMAPEPTSPAHTPETTTPTATEDNSERSSSLPDQTPETPPIQEKHPQAAETPSKAEEKTSSVSGTEETKPVLTLSNSHVPPASMAEVNKPIAFNQLKGRATQQANLISTTPEKYLDQPDGYKPLLTNPTHSLARYWLTVKLQEKGLPIPPKVSDLMVELHTIVNGKAPNRLAEMGRVSKELDAAIQGALSTEKTFVERMLDGEEPIALTGKALPPGAIDGKVVKPKETPKKAQQPTFFDQDSKDQYEGHQKELADLEVERATIQPQYDAMVQEVARGLAKDATAANEEARKSLWDRIKQHGYIAPPKNKKGREDFYSRLPNTVNHLKRKDGRPIDELASDLGYGSEDALVRDIITLSKAGKVTEQEVIAAAEEIAAGTLAGANLKAQLDYFRDAETSVREAMAELEGGNREQARETEPPRQGGPARGTAQAVPGDRTAGSTGSQREASTGQSQTPLTQEGATRGERPSSMSEENPAFMGPRPTLPTNTPPLAPVSRRAIVKYLDNAFGPIRVGMKGKILGLFKRRDGVIRTKGAEDFPVQTHEIGHRLDRDMQLADPTFDAELIPLGTPTSPQNAAVQYIRGEGVGEFIRLYITDPTQAQQQAPNFYAHFLTRMNAEPEVKAKLDGARELVKRWTSQNPHDKLNGVISVDEEGSKRPISWERFKAQVIEQLAPLERATKQLAQGRNLTVDENPFELALLARGWAGRAEAFLEYGIVDKDFNKVGESFKDILEDVKDKDAFRRYTVSRRAKEILTTRRTAYNQAVQDESQAKALVANLKQQIQQAQTYAVRNPLKQQLAQAETDLAKARTALATAKDRVLTIEQVVGVGVSEPEVDQVITDLQGEYEPLHRRMVKFQDAILQELVDSGRLAPQEAAAMRKMNEEYIPFHRFFDEKSGAFNVAGANHLVNVGNPIKGFKGSDRTIVDPLESVIKNTYAIVNAAQRNRVGRALLDLAEKSQNMGAVVEVVDEEAKDSNIVNVWRDGEKVRIKVDPELHRSLLFLDREQTAMWVKIMGLPARTLRAGAILNPDFLASNPLADQITAFINSEYGYVPFLDLLRGIWHTGGKTDTFWKFMAAGGAQSQMVSLDRSNLQKELNKYIESRTWTGTIVKRANPLEWLRAMSEFGELGTRLGEFRKGVVQDGSREGVQRAALEARDVTIDFARTGSKTKTVNQISAFFNASIQGLDKTAREFKAHPIRTTAKAVAAYTIPSFILFLINKDNPYYEEKPEWAKDAFWFVPLDWSGGVGTARQSKHFLWIPKKHALAMTFGALPERLLRTAFKHDPRAFDLEFGQRFAESLLPTMPMPNALLTLFENAWGPGGYSTYTDLPLVPQRELRLEPRDRYGPYTSDIGKLAGGITNTSPRKWDNLIRGWTGGLGTLAAQGIGTGLRTLDKVTDVPYVDSTATTADRGVAAYPIARRFLRDLGEIGIGSSYDEFTDKLTLAEQKYSSTSDKDAKAQLLKALKPMRKVEDKLSDLTSKRRETLADSTLSAEEKRRLVDEIDMELTNEARKALGKPEITN